MASAVQTRMANLQAIAAASQSEKDQLVELALGRIFSLMMRPYQDGDIAVYEECRAIVRACAPESAPPFQVSYARDYNKGAQGD